MAPPKVVEFAVPAVSVPLPSAIAPMPERSPTRLVEAVEIEGAAGIDRERPGGREAAARSELQRPGVDGGASGIGICRGEDRRAGTVLLERAAAGDDAAECERVGAIDRKSAVVRDVAGDRSARATIAELQGAAGDRGAAAIAVPA